MKLLGFWRELHRDAENSERERKKKKNSIKKQKNNYSVTIGTF